jgi:putative nucleotidyltransferase with HDIG domain
MNAAGPVRVLFVDDESLVLEGLQRMLRPLRSEWDMQFVDSGEGALALMATAPFHVVVSDMRMPGMSGADLLSEVMKRHPSTIRLILSGQSDHEQARKTVGTAHQYLSKPCDADTLKATVTRATGLLRIMSSDRLRLLIGRMDTLPSLPALYHQLVALMNRPNATLKQVGELIAQDMSMAAKVLQLVNSAFFGLGRNVTSPVEAAGLLGLETIQALVLSLHAFTSLDAARMSGLHLEAMWEHSMAVSSLARDITASERAPRAQVDAAFMAGMLHDIGKLVLAANLPEDYARVLATAQAQRIPLHEAERTAFGESHGEVGAYLLGLWGIANPIVEAIAFHHQPLSCSDHAFCPLTAVHVADALHHARSGEARPGDLAAGYLKELGMQARLDVWCQLSARCSPEASDG